ncbi:MAG: tetratricopeptide repeat protein [Terracidiphilus sp.]
MLKSRTMRNRLLGAAVLCLLFLPAPKRAHAVSKEIVELQTQVQQLMDMVQRLQSTMDSRFGVMQHLAEQTADAANQVTSTVNAIQQKLNAQSDALSGKVDAVSGQVQSLNDSVDELKSRVAKLDKSLQDMQQQLQAMQAQQTQAAQPAAGAPGAGDQPAQNVASNGPGAPAPNAPSTQQAPPLQETLQSGERDFDAGHLDVAAGEFQDVVHYYPLDDAAGTAQFYLGEIAYQKQDYAHAIDAYNAVLEGFSGNAKAPAAQLHKGLALLAQDKKDAGIHELRLLIQRHPQTPEAARARSKLNGMGVRINVTK